MAADGGARELDPVAFTIDADQGKIAGATADITNQNDLLIEQLFV